MNEIRSNSKGDYFVGLNEQGLVRVFDKDGHQRAERQFKPGKSELQLRPSVDLSPSSNVVLYDSGLYSDKKVIWSWEADKVKEFELQTHNSRLHDDTTAWGFWSGSDSTTASLLSGNTDSEQTTLFRADNFVLSSTEILDGVGTIKGLGGVALISQHGINLLQSVYDQPEFADSGEEGINQLGYTLNPVLYQSIWPHSSAAPKLLAYDPVTQTLARSTDDKIHLFTQWMQDKLGASLDVNASFWSLDVAGENALVVFDRVLQVVDLRTLGMRQHVLSSPKPDKDYTFIPWGVAATTDVRWVAVLWQESDAQGSMASNYFRKIVRVYELPETGVTDPPRVVGEVLLGDYHGAPGRSNRELWIAPDAKIIAFCNANGLVAAYRVADGQQLYKMRVPHAGTFARHTNPPLLGTADPHENGEFRVWNPLNGQVVAHIPVNEQVLRAAFSQDGKTAFLGMDSRQLRQYRLSDGALLSKIDTAVLPVGISPAGNRYVGFLADTPTAGSTFLADLSNGRTLEVLDPSAHILNDAYFSSDGRTFAFVWTRETMRILRSLDIPEALHWLQYAAIEPELAAVSDDFLDYREKLAERNTAQASAAVEKDQRGVAIDAYHAAQDIIEGLVADFPDNSNYTAMLALNCERLASIESDSIRKNGLQERSQAIRRKLARIAPELNLQSSDSDLLNELAWEAATAADPKLRNGSQAVKLATRACELTEFQYPAYVDTLAAAYAEAGDFDAAVKWSEEAIKLLDEDASEEYRSHMTRALDSYKVKKPFRQPPPDGAENPPSPQSAIEGVAPPPLPPGAESPESQPPAEGTSPANP